MGPKNRVLDGRAHWRHVNDYTHGGYKWVSYQLGVATRPVLKFLRAVLFIITDAGVSCSSITGVNPCKGPTLPSSSSFIPLIPFQFSCLHSYRIPFPPIDLPRCEEIYWNLAMGSGANPQPAGSQAEITIPYPYTQNRIAILNFLFSRISAGSKPLKTFTTEISWGSGLGNGHRINVCVVDDVIKNVQIIASIHANNYVLDFIVTFARWREWRVVIMVIRMLSSTDMGKIWCPPLIGGRRFGIVVTSLEVTLRRARLVLGWATVYRGVYTTQLRF